MLSANQFASFFNQPYLQNKSVKLSDFLLLIQIHIDRKFIKIFLVAVVKNGHDQSAHRTLKFTVSQESWNYNMNKNNM